MIETAVYTIGYGARNMEDFIQVLQANNITYLIDVRSRPYSRYKPEFSKEALDSHLQTHQIRYVFMGDTLGGQPDDPDCYTDGKVNYEKCHQKPFFLEGIGRLRRAWEQKLPVAIMCSEGKPENCHRSKLIAPALAEQGIIVIHIDENDQLITHADLQRRIAPLFNLLPPEEETAAPFPSAGTGVGPPPPPDFDDFFYDTYISYDDEWDTPYEPSINPFADDLKALPQYSGDMDLNAAQTLLKQVFGYDEFRPLQADIIENVLQKRDTVTIMPTGSGKSLCYQLPALMFNGLTVVVSPLISLMEDQVSSLREFGVTAVYLNSTLNYEQYLYTAQQIRQGQVKLLYVAPETLLRPETLVLLDESRVACLAIDESHCISEWGHDFRPEYRQLVAVRQRLPQAVCIALTATATPRVRRDIRQSLGLDKANEFLASFNRENLFLEVQPKTEGLRQVLTFLADHREQSGIIYCATRKQVDTLTDQLAANGWSALPYHAGLDDATRRRHQRQFSRDDVAIMVATIAFGMGIDKSNVRFIVHYDLPKNLESYYQQIGRAGRDGLRSDCLLLFSYSDVQTINFFINQQAPSEQKGAAARLQAMIGFAETNVCRRSPLLEYFGENYAADSCEMCDNCLAEDEELVDVTIPAQKFLSCVKRTGEIFGMTHVIDVLRGSQSQKILQRRHNELSTYGIGTEFSKKQWQHLARQFIQQGLMIQDMEHGSLKLTPKAYAVFKGEAVLGTVQEERQVAAVRPLSPDHDPVLFAQLRAKRKELADAANVPPYVIFSDRSLVEMAAYFPQSRASFATMYGVGQAKLEKYADAFLPIIQSYCRANQIAEKAKTAVTPNQPRTGENVVLSPRAVEIGLAYDEGKSVGEITAVLGIQQRTVIGHLYKYAQAGNPLRADGFREMSQLPAEMQEKVIAAYAELGTDFLRPVYEALEEAVSWDELHIMRLYVLSKMGKDKTTAV